MANRSLLLCKRWGRSSAATARKGAGVRETTTGSVGRGLGKERGGGGAGIKNVAIWFFFFGFLASWTVKRVKVTLFP